MKSIISILLAFMLLLCACPALCAQGNVSDIIGGNQDHLLLATVVDIDGSSIILAPYHSIYVNDSATKSLNENITVEKFRYSYCDDHTDISMSPRVGDNIFISLDKSGSKYTMANGAYKISSVDYKLLTFYASESMRESECLADIVALAYFVRTDGSMRDFRFENGSLTTYIDDRPLTLYPTENIAETISFVDLSGQVIGGAKIKDVIIDGEKPVEDEIDYRWLVAYGIIFLGALVGGIVVYNATAKDILNRKSSRKESK
ncbi:MAG: hypothetical protein IJN62_01410 [Clostridia bacterium]|nr:hypothetical protein [Clostridia bacterium]